jgi:hypothetical protein
MRQSAAVQHDVKACGCLAITERHTHTHMPLLAGWANVEECQPLLPQRKSVTTARLGSARLGSARLGSARLGSARLGSARLGSARLGSARLRTRRRSLLCSDERRGTIATVLAVRGRHRAVVRRGLVVERASCVLQLHGARQTDVVCGGR